MRRMRLLLLTLLFSIGISAAAVFPYSFFAGHMINYGRTNIGVDIGLLPGSTLLQSERKNSDEGFYFPTHMLNAFVRVETLFNKGSFSLYVSPALNYTLDFGTAHIDTGPEIGLTDLNFDCGWSARVGFAFVEFEAAYLYRTKWLMGVSIYIPLYFGLA